MKKQFKYQLIRPITVRHIIDEDSPFYDILLKYQKWKERKEQAEEDIKSATKGPIEADKMEVEKESIDYELIMTVEGIVEATGMTFQVCFVSKIIYLTFIFFNMHKKVHFKLISFSFSFLGSNII